MRQPFSSLEARRVFRPRTSQSHPLEIAEVQADPAFGRIGLTFCPGKHDQAAATGAWARDLDVDLDAIRDWGAQALVTLVEPAELVALKVENLGAAALARGLDWRHLPIADYGVPSPLFERRWRNDGRDLRAILRRGGDVVVHCKGGLGRAGLIAARLLAELGVEPDQAIKMVRRARRGAIETPTQLALARRMARVDDVARVDPAALTKISGARGSQPGGVFADAQGRQFYLKTLESPQLARNEALAARLYQLAGAPSLTYLPTLDPAGVATEWAPLDKKRLSEFDAMELKQARRWLGVHAWTANWDAVGFHGDNQGVAEGVALTLDLGGALDFRAQGDPKGAAFGERVDEIERLRRDEDNPHAKKLFGPMSAAEVAAAIREVTQIPDAAIARTLAEGGAAPALAEKMIRRQADLRRRLEEKAFF